MNKSSRSLLAIEGAVDYIQAFLALASVLLLLFGLVSATFNLLSDGLIFAALPWLGVIWAGSQALSVDSSLALTFLNLALAIRARQWVRAAVYGVIGAPLLIVAAYIVDAESLKQALGISLAAAVAQLPGAPVVSIGFLTQLRSWVVVLLVAASRIAMLDLHDVTALKGKANALDGLERHNEAASEQGAGEEEASGEVEESLTVLVGGEAGASVNGHEKRTRYRVAEYFTINPTATVSQAAATLGISPSSVRRYRSASKASSANGQVLV